MCKKRSEDVRRCMIPVCGKFYHGECIANFAPTVAVNRGFRCSIHVCLTCFIANPNSSTISKGEAGHMHTLLHFRSVHLPHADPAAALRSSGTVCALSNSLSCYRPVHGSGLCHPLQQQHHLSQPLHSSSGC